MSKTSKGRYVYYQPNDKDIKDQYGDCQLRALSKALGISWLEAFDLSIPICREVQTYTLFGGSCNVGKDNLAKLGFRYVGISNKRGTSRPTVDEFAKAHPIGSFICKVAHHVVAVVDGKYYDTWNSGYKSLYGYYERIN